MRTLILALTLVLAAAPALAADGPVATRGAMLRDANDVRVGQVDRVAADGSVGLIIGSKYVTVPADKLALVEGKLTTSLTKKEIARLR